VDKGRATIYLILNVDTMEFSKSILKFQMGISILDSIRIIKDQVASIIF